MIAPEIVRGFVPSIRISPKHGFGTKSYAVLVTDARMVLLPWREGKTILGSMIDAGPIETEGVATTESALNPEAWGQQTGAVEIPHSAMVRLRCHRTLNTYFLTLEFTSAEGHRELSGFLIPSRGYLRRKRKEGIRSSKSTLTYAKAAERVFRQIPRLGSVIDWRT